MEGTLRLVPLGFQQITDVSAAVGLTVPAGATVAIIVAFTQAVRWRDDGTNPTAAIGIPLAVSTEFQYVGNLNAIKFFQISASAQLNISYYRIAG